ncbi:MAG: hypothetical protein WBZ40_13075 [Acidimicrobiia bacterium]
MGGFLLTSIRRPVLFWEAIRAFFAMRSHRGLFPSSSYVDWRVHTAYGDGMSGIRQDDLIEFLAWRRRMRVFK